MRTGQHGGQETGQKAVRGQRGWSGNQSRFCKQYGAQALAMIRAGHGSRVELLGQPKPGGAASQRTASTATKFGAVFTRPEVAGFILDLCNYTTDRPLHNMRLLEPAVGRGDFLAPAVQRLMNRTAAPSISGSAQNKPTSRTNRPSLSVALGPESSRWQAGSGAEIREARHVLSWGSRSQDCAIVGTATS